MSSIAITFSVVFTVKPAHAVIVDGIDLRATMKQMRFEYNQAMKTDSVAVFNKHISQFRQQLEIAQQFKFPEEKLVKAQEGLNKVAAALNGIQKPITKLNLTTTQQQLSLIDDLRDQYHEKQPSTWDRLWTLIFGESS